MLILIHASTGFKKNLNLIPKMRFKSKIHISRIGWFFTSLLPRIATKLNPYLLLLSSVLQREQVDVSLRQKGRFEEAEKRCLSPGTVPVPHGGFLGNFLSCF